MIPFNKPFVIDKEIDYIKEAIERGVIRGDGEFSAKCHNFLQEHLPAKKALLTHSCTAALEMAAILADIKAGDEVIMPSYTFVSTANAFVLRGGVPVFVDIKPDTKNIDENLIEAAITSKTKAIVPVHYAGVACEMDKIMQIAKKHNLIVIEDAAQGVWSEYKGQKLGTIGDIGCFSFTKRKMSLAVRVELSSSTMTNLYKEPKSSEKRAQTARNFSVARWINTLGLMSAHLTCLLT